jgi:hypothetical protein
MSMKKIKRDHRENREEINNIQITKSNKLIKPKIKRTKLTD